MIINADDFGYSQSVNKAVCDCFNNKLINRTTIMVNMPCCDEAVELSKKNGFFSSVGLHINLTEGKALSKACAKSPLCDENGFFKGDFHVPFKSRLYLDNEIKKAIYCEAEAQIKKYIGYGFTLMHADSHNYTHTYFSVYSAIYKLLKKYGFKTVRISRNVSPDKFSLPFRIYKTVFNSVIKNLKVGGRKIGTTAYFGSFQDYMGLENKPEDINNIEFMTHPDYIDGVLTDNTLPKPHNFVSGEWLEGNNLHFDEVSGGKIKLFVGFIHAHTGGAMTSLINFLNAIDTQKYDVDIMFYENDGRYGIKDEINILPQGKIHKKGSLSNILKKSLSPAYVIAAIQDKYYKKIKKNKRKAVQIMSKQGCRFSRKIDKEYDIAIAYEFNWCMNYIIKNINAKKKVIWHHVEYEKSGMDFKIDKKALDKADALVFVSEECKNSYISNHPEHREKSYFIPNLLSSSYVRAKGEETVSLPFENSENLLKFITVARISFEHKGLDRAVKVFSKLKDDGLLNNVKWLIIGHGRDMEKLKNMIEENGLTDVIYPIGLKENPIPYLKKADCFLLPSRHEGKPMVITESFIMGLVPVVTEYTSAHEQIDDGVDGLIFENNDEALYLGLKKVLNNPKLISELKKNVINKDYGNEKEISKFYSLTDKLL